jgi:asparagine synthase (glutamine-hydrolysing)
MRPLLPSDIINRRKHGFAVPIGEWFKNELKTYATEVFQDRTTKQRGFFDTDFMQFLLDEHQKETEDYSSQLWALLIFELWCREYLDK